MSDFSAFALFTAGLAALAPVASAYTTAVGDTPSGNAIYEPGLNSVVPAGKPFTITWEPTTAGKISLLLCHGPSTNCVITGAIADSVANSGSYSWTPSTDLEPSQPTGYGIQLVVEGTGQYQYSTQFGISNPSYSSVGSSSTAPTATSAPAESAVAAAYGLESSSTGAVSVVNKAAAAYPESTLSSVAAYAAPTLSSVAAYAESTSVAAVANAESTSTNSTSVPGVFASAAATGASPSTIAGVFATGVSAAMASGIFASTATGIHDSAATGISAHHGNGTITTSAHASAGTGNMAYGTGHAGHAGASGWGFANATMIRASGSMSVPSSLRTSSKGSRTSSSGTSSTGSSTASASATSSGAASTMGASFGGLAVAAGIAVFAL